MDESTLDAFAEWERASWEERADAYAADVGVLTRGAIWALLDAARVTEGTRLLDVATGPGFVAQAAVGRGAVVTAVDQSAAMVGLARTALPEITIHQTSVEQLGLADDAYDAVVAGFLLNHLARPERALAELTRVLAPGGRLAMSVWAEPVANPAMGLIGEVVTELGITGAVPPGPDSTYFSNEGRFTDLLTGAGLQDVIVVRTSWTVEVDAGAWFDTVARAMPRSGAVLTLAEPEQRGQAREEYVRRAEAAFGTDDGLVRLPATAVIGAGSQAART